MAAAQYAGLHEVPVVVINVDNLKSLEFACRKCSKKRSEPN